MRSNAIGTATVYALLLAGDVLVTAIYVAVAAALSIGVTLMVFGAGLLLAIVLREKTRALQALGSEMGRTNQLLYGAVIAHVQSLKTTKAYNAESHDREVFRDLSSAVSERAQRRDPQTGVQQRMVRIGIDS